MKKLDTSLFIAVVGLAIFGLVMMSSMSVSASFELTSRLFDEPSNNYYFLKHLQYLVLFATPAFLLGAWLPSSVWRKWSPLMYLGGIALLILVFFIGENYNTTARQWIKLPGIPSIQPVEIVKIAMVVFFSALFANKKLEPDTFAGGFLPFVVILAVPSALIIAQPDFGSWFVMTTACAAIYFAAGGHIRHMIVGAIVALGGLLGLIKLLQFDYIFRRLGTFFAPDPTSDVAYQITQAKIAIGSGGLWGRGFQNSIQKFNYLPEVQSDTIFSAISEEMGFFRILLLIGVYLLIAHRGFHIAAHAPDQFTKLLAVGLTTLVVGQAFINIAVNLALFPNTGITLPLLSYGGTSLMFTLLTLGILLHISGNLQYRNKRY